jgi:hypothetical protein
VLPLSLEFYVSPQAFILRSCLLSPQQPTLPTQAQLAQACAAQQQSAAEVEALRASLVEVQVNMANQYRPRGFAAYVVVFEASFPQGRAEALCLALSTASSCLTT